MLRNLFQSHFSMFIIQFHIFIGNQRHEICSPFDQLVLPFQMDCSSVRCHIHLGSSLFYSDSVDLTKESFTQMSPTRDHLVWY